MYFGNENAVPQNFRVIQRGGMTPLRPIVNVGRTEKTDVVELTSGFSGYSAGSGWWTETSGFSGADYIWYSPADSATKNGTWGPLSRNLISTDTATAEMTLQESGFAGDFSDSVSISGAQLIGGAQNICQSKADLAIDVSTIYVPPSTNPSLVGGEQISVGGLVYNSGSSTSAWQICNLGEYSANNVYVLYGFSFGASSGNLTVSTITMNGFEIDFADSSYNQLATLSINGSTTQSTASGGGRSGTSVFNNSSVVLPLTYAGTIAFARVRIRWTCSVPLSFPDAYGVGLWLKIAAVTPAVAGYKVNYISRGNGPSISVTGSAIGTYSQVIPYALPSNTGYLRFALPNLTWSSGVYAVTGYFYPPFPTSLNGSTTGIANPALTQGDITEVSGNFEIAFGSGTCTLSGYSIIEEFYHWPITIDDASGNFYFEHLKTSGSISTDRTAGSSGFSSLKRTFVHAAEQSGDMHTYKDIHPPVPDFTLE